MISTAWDYAVFCQMYLNGGAYGGKRVLSGQLAAAATKPQSEHIKAAQRYGFGWSASSQDGVFSHGGSDGTWAWVDPRREIIGLVFTQCQRVRNPRNEFRRRVTAACTDVSPESRPSASRPSGRR